MMKVQLLLLAAVLELSTSFLLLPSGMERMIQLYSSSTTDDFASFAASLEDDDKRDSKKYNAATPSKDPMTKNKSWQEDLDEFLDPLTPAARKQILLSDLASADRDIRESVESAFRERKIDPLLTPRGKRLQDGTRAVARQLVGDILPSFASSSSSSIRNSGQLFPMIRFPRVPDSEEVSRLGSRFFNAVNNQIQTGLETLQEDLQDPTTRIPQRLSKQREEIWQEASNVWSETPAGLKEPEYTVVATTEAYEIRDYAGYKVASTNMVDGMDDPYFKYDASNIGEQGKAFNSLASYLFGANRQKAVLEMTTPVTTTMSGQMRFFVDTINPPEPLEQDESRNIFETGTIRVEDIPPARLAVRRFYGFVTQGEIARQKEALLTALALDGDYELDVPHGQTVGHLIFQYNPPYTLPVVRRNEIAVPIQCDSLEAEDSPSDMQFSETETWTGPSDVESAD